LEREPERTEQARITDYEYENEQKTGPRSAVATGEIGDDAESLQAVSEVFTAGRDVRVSTADGTPVWVADPTGRRASSWGLRGPHDAR